MNEGQSDGNGNSNITVNDINSKNNSNSDSRSLVANLMSVLKAENIKSGESLVHTSNNNNEISVMDLPRSIHSKNSRNDRNNKRKSALKDEKLSMNSSVTMNSAWTAKRLPHPFKLDKIDIFTAVDDVFNKNVEVVFEY